MNIFIHLCFATRIIIGSAAIAQPPSGSGRGNYNLALEAGAGVALFPTGSYIEPGRSLSLLDLGNRAKERGIQYARFDRQNTVGYSAGIRLEKPLGERWGISLGFRVVLMNYSLKSNVDTVIHYNQWRASQTLNFRLLANAYAYHYVYNGIQIPLRMHFNPGRLQISIGASLLPIAYRVAHYEYWVGVYETPGIDQLWTTSPESKTVYQLRTPMHVNGCLQVEYHLNLAGVNLAPFLDAEYAINNLEELVLRTGLIIPLHDAPR